MTPEEINEKIVEWRIGELVLRKFNRVCSRSYTLKDVTFSVTRVEMKSGYDYVTLVWVKSLREDLTKDFAVELKNYAKDEIVITEDQMEILDGLLQAQFQQ